jgi:1,4-alpha-glucan branching enzyme
VGVPFPGFWEEVLNSDATEFGGSGIGNLGGTESVSISYHNQYHSLTLTLPPLAVLVLRWVRTT